MRTAKMRDPWPALCATAVLCFSYFIFPSTATDCTREQAKCNPACVAVERVFHRHGTSASSSALMALPQLTNNYVLCYSKPVSTKRKSQILCVNGAMDDLQNAQPQFVILADGVVTNFEAFAVGTKQYVVIFAMNRSPILYEVSVKDHTLVNFHALRVIGAAGALDMAVAQYAHTTVLVTSSGRQCREGDRQCGYPSVSIIDQKANTITQCTTANSGPAEYVAAWTANGAHYVVLASLIPENAFAYRIALHQIVQGGSGECALVPVEEISFGRAALCGVQSLEVITNAGADNLIALMVSNHHCPEVVNGILKANSEKANTLYLLWDANTQKFVRVADELPATSGVSKISRISEQFFLCQKTSEPSTVHISDVLAETLPNSLVGTVRVNNQASISAVQSANRDAYITHVTSSGSVVIDWISCAKNQLIKASNYTFSQYTGNVYLTGSNNLTEPADEVVDNSNHLHPNRRFNLRRPDRDSPRAMPHMEDLPAAFLHSDLVNTTSNATDSSLLIAPQIRYEDVLIDRHVEEPQLLHPSFPNDGHGQGSGMPRPGPELSAPQPVFGQAPVPEGLSQPNMNNWMQGMGYQMMGSGQPMTVFMGPNGPLYPGGFGGPGPQQVPPGSAFAGYITFPPVAVFSPVPTVYPMPPNANIPNAPQNTEQPPSGAVPPQFHMPSPAMPPSPWWNPDPRFQAPPPMQHAQHVQPVARPWEQPQRGLPNAIPPPNMIHHGPHRMVQQPNYTSVQQPPWIIEVNITVTTPPPETNATTILWTMPSESSLPSDTTSVISIESATDATDAIPVTTSTLTTDHTSAPDTTMDSTVPPSVSDVTASTDLISTTPVIIDSST
ncbi:uncharacterized protein LOC129583950 [Paramacrobiotus metropolitanus]|uniref:uncharacterized protein LOC129583950 n=1 Tax=Paramacrobiotus metropolitanus TaxID=2943436 RepID=UPI00244572FC|nr:uncharacterized protein LOC129583950 [Paramacrobiotus metropolitanus]